MELSRPKLKNLLIFQEELPKTNKKSVLKKFLVSCDVFLIFTALNHREMPCEACMQHRDITSLLHLEKQLRRTAFYTTSITSDENAGNNGTHKGSS